MVTDMEWYKSIDPEVYTDVMNGLAVHILWSVDSMDNSDGLLLRNAKLYNILPKISHIWSKQNGDEYIRQVCVDLDDKDDFDFMLSNAGYKGDAYKMHIWHDYYADLVDQASRKAAASAAECEKIMRARMEAAAKAEKHNS